MLQTVLNGRPIGPQATKVAELFRKADAGQLVPHRAIEAALGERRTSWRYRSVICSAAKMLARDDSIVLVSVRGDGYVKADAAGKLADSAGHMHRASRAVKRSIRSAACVTDTEATEPQKAQRDHVLGQAKYLYELSKTARKQIDLTVGGVK